MKVDVTFRTPISGFMRGSLRCLTAYPEHLPLPHRLPMGARLNASVVTDAEYLEGTQNTSPARGRIPAYAIVPLAKEKQARKQAWLCDACGDFFTACDSGAAQ